LYIASGGAIVGLTTINVSNRCGANMNDPVYKLIELTGTSTTSIEDAVAKAIKRAHRTVKDLCWFQVVETRGNIIKGLKAVERGCARFCRCLRPPPRTECGATASKVPSDEESRRGALSSGLIDWKT
jgi:hypothetical protein